MKSLRPTYYPAILLVGLLILFSSQTYSQAGSVTTSPPLTTNNGSGGITFNVEANQAVIIDTLWCTFYSASALNISIWYNTSPINGAPTINSTNGWTELGPTSTTPVGTAFAGAAIQPIPFDLNLLIPGGEEYGFYIGMASGSGVAYTTYATGNATSFTDGVITVTNGTNVGYGGNSPSPGFSVRQYNGRVVYSLPYVDQFPYCQDFEDGDGQYATGGVLSTWEHDEPNNTFIANASSSTHAWVTDVDGDYNNDEGSFVGSPRFDFTDLIDPEIRFMATYDIETPDDGATFQVSTDSGTTWATLGSTSSPGNWFNTSNVESFNLLNSLHGWSGSSSWVQMAHSVSAYAGDTNIMFRWYMGADGAVTEEGFAFDDIIVAESNDLMIVELIYPDSQCGSTVDVISGVICNNSVIPLSGFNVDLDTNGTTVSNTYSDTLGVCACDTMELLSFNTSQGGVWQLEAIIDNTGDVNSSNDTLTGMMTMYGIPGGSVSGGGNFCEGDVATLTMNFTGIGPWNVQYTNGSTPTYVAGVTSPFTAPITQSGTYTISYLQDSTGCPTDSGSVTGEATFVFNPAPVIDLGPDSTVCGDYQLDAGSGYSVYDWSTGATTQMITVTSPGIYSVTVTDTNGCDGSDEVDLEVNPNPVVGMNDTVLCDGSTFLFNAGGGYASYLWHDGSTGQVFQVSGVTTVSVTVTDFNDCEGIGTASITAVVANPEPNVTGGSGFAPVTMSAPAGFSGYLWNNSAMTQTIDVYVSGTYTCTVTDNNGCEGSDDAKAKIWPVGVEDIVAQEGFAVYPNPASSQITVMSSTDVGPITRIEMVDINGILVMSYVPVDTKLNQVLSLPDHIPSGNYIIKGITDSDILEAVLTVVTE
ncbi:MAG: T9SS type A sorting domain-containing protein [Flavobacteriales bacterium]|jgi:hypothetical protein|nr:T9SS type A sorting domain-containing protein [Flavobacteriales bacterium]MBT3964373.1 T9SS type A sorting domain-containing protein [Flavobacteriales bacterium]MBT4704965.1 T9SS type A sorting domain-containing protein [Flavobacteriales bacterium]MBT4929740.1 T9SS type A sorting domain-containing protein [Flavobacteriales bacterium]MBT5132818.1 T9SS type A sorting domain-containing protein [Flavobacteriales bacterium]